MAKESDGSLVLEGEGKKVFRQICFPLMINNHKSKLQAAGYASLFHRRDMRPGCH
jgi:hypothetical protein